MTFYRNSPETFWAKVDKSGGPDACWPWTARSHLKGGYGQMMYRKVRQGAHRLAYILTHGSVPDGLIVCHSCDNPPCCNPAHLYAGTPLDNARDTVARGLRVAPQPTHCRRGHPFDEANTYVWTTPSGRKQRSCRACNRSLQARKKAQEGAR